LRCPSEPWSPPTVLDSVSESVGRGYCLMFLSSRSPRVRICQSCFLHPSRSSPSALWAVKISCSSC
jgi:hypothetical protein